MTEDSVDQDVTLFQALGLKDHTPIKAIDLAELEESTIAPAVVMLGQRVFGLVEPRMLAAGPDRPRTRSATRSGGAAPPPPPARAPAPPPLAAAPAPLAPAPVAEPVRLDAAAHINAPRRAQPGKKFRLEIGLAATPSPGVEGGKVSIAFQPGETEIALEIHVECEGFTSNKGFDHTLRITREDPFTPRLELWLTADALPDGIDEELRALQVLYSCKGIACGNATWRILVQRTDAAVDLPTASADRPRVSIDTSTPPIDLTLRMAWQDDNEATHTLRWSFTSPHTLPAPAGKMVRSSPELAALPIGIVDELAQGDGLDGVELLISGIGKRIADEIPAGVFELLGAVTAAVRKARGPDAIPTVLLLTQETRVPWELALLEDPLPDPARPPVLGAQYIVSRWLLDDKVRTLPPHTPTAAEVVAVFGDYANAGGVSELPYARKEADFLAQHDGEKVEATRQAIVSLLQDQAKDSGGAPLTPGILHFAGHGEASRPNVPASFIILNDGSTLSTSYFLSAPVLKKHHPLVFLNACQLGAATQSLGQPGGFAGVCVRAQASVVIAPLWSVNDQVAYHLATEFYGDILGGVPVAEAMFKARQQPYVDVEVKDQAGEVHMRRTATRLAYLVYGHPAFHL